MRRELFYYAFCHALKSKGMKLENQVFKAALGTMMGIEYFSLTEKESIDKQVEKFNVNPDDIKDVMNKVGYGSPEERSTLSGPFSVI